MKVTTTFDKEKFRKVVRAMATRTFNEFSEFAQSFIVEEKREFPRNTYRDYGVGVTGKYAGKIRDVVDSGQLRDSYEQRFEYSPTMCKLLLQWTASHAQKVYAGEGIIPPYPWVLLAMREFDWDKSFRDSLAVARTQ